MAGDGRIVYSWPPEGRFLALWERFDLLFTDEEKHNLLALLRRWQQEGSSLVAYMDPETGEWVDVEPEWSVVDGWLKPES